mgnify:CR=1 FL=1
MLGYLYPITTYLGLYNIGTNLTLLFQMQTYSLAVSFIGLIFDVLLLIFIVVACLLIYSLLLISVETKTFEIAVMRLVGLNKGGLISLIMTQAALFVIPAVVVGFIFSVPSIWFIYSMLFTEDLGYMPSILPGWYASIQALIIGIFIPLLSSIVPIKRAISKNLTDALNTQRSAKSAGLLVTFTDNDSNNLIPYILFGSITVLFGISIYYFLPLGLLTMNIGMVLGIFIAILMGMLLGLTLFVTNLQSFIEILQVYVFFFWERKSMRALLRKNLIAHKSTNKMTSIIYALTLGCVIFLCVSLNLLIKSIDNLSVNLPGSDIVVTDYQN